MLVIWNSLQGVLQCVSAYVLPSNIFSEGLNPLVTQVVGLDLSEDQVQ